MRNHMLVKLFSRDYDMSTALRGNTSELQIVPVGQILGKQEQTDRCMEDYLLAKDRPHAPDLTQSSGFLGAVISAVVFVRGLVRKEAATVIALPVNNAAKP
jgi:hypothetical protein